ncbi:MAG: tripartite tricarboxylate transporter substrate binding protein [Xanthobacteraceae bacterium]
MRSHVTRIAVRTYVAAALIAVASNAATAQPQSYPARPIRIVVPAAPGGPTDAVARLASQFISKLGQPVVVENRGGAGGALGAREVAGAAPDGYTLLAGNTSTLAVIPATSANAGYDPSKDFVPVALFWESYQLLVVHPSQPWMSLKELVDEAKANPGKLAYAHTGSGGMPFLSGELFMARAGINLVRVPYRSGGELATAVLTQAVQLTIGDVGVMLPLVQEGKLRALAVTSNARTSLAPEVPTMIEAGVPDYDVITYSGIVAPAGTPHEVVRKLNTVINSGLSSPDSSAAIMRLGAIPRPATPEDFAAFITAKRQHWENIARSIGARVN